EALKLLPYYPPREEHPFFAARPEDACFATPRPPAARPAQRKWRRIAAAASLAGVVAIGGAAAAAHMRGLLSVDARQAQAMAHRLDAMSARLETLEANRSRDETASVKKLLAEIRSGAAGTRDVGGAVGQLAARVAKVEKDQGT